MGIFKAGQFVKVRPQAVMREAHLLPFSGHVGMVTRVTSAHGILVEVRFRDVPELRGVDIPFLPDQLEVVRA